MHAAASDHPLSERPDPAGGTSAHFALFTSARFALL